MGARLPCRSGGVRGCGTQSVDVQSREAVSGWPSASEDRVRTSRIAHTSVSASALEAEDRERDDCSMQGARRLSDRAVQREEGPCGLSPHGPLSPGAFRPLAMSWLAAWSRLNRASCQGVR